MAHVGGEDRQFSVEIGAFPVPTNETVNGECMANVVKPRPLPPATVRDSHSPQELTENAAVPLTPYVSQCLGIWQTRGEVVRVIP